MRRPTQVLIPSAPASDEALVALVRDQFEGNIPGGVSNVRMERYPGERMIVVTPSTDSFRHKAVRFAQTLRLVLTEHDPSLGIVVE